MLEICATICLIALILSAPICFFVFVRILASLNNDKKKDSIALTEIHHNLEAIRAMLELRERK